MPRRRRRLPNQVGGAFGINTFAEQLACVMTLVFLSARMLMDLLFRQLGRPKPEFALWKSPKLAPPRRACIDRRVQVLWTDRVDKLAKRESLLTRFWLASRRENAPHAPEFEHHGWIRLALNQVVTGGREIGLSIGQRRERYPPMVIALAGLWRGIV